MYRSSIFILTVAIFAITYITQGPIFANGHSESQIHHSTLLPNDVTLIWLMAVPMSVCLWVGWVFFLQYVPWRTAQTPHSLRGGVIVRYVTRGKNVEAINLSVQTAHEVFERAGLADRVRIQVISDVPIDLPHYAGLLVVPNGFEAPKASQFKARALYYAQTRLPAPANQWVLYFDEESRMTDSALQGIAEFISQHHHDLRPPIGQGPIAYTGGHWFWRGADAMRLSDDLGRFRLQYHLGVPIFGAHGSYLLMRGDVDQALPFDVGRENSLTEDTAWALLAWQKGYHFGWVNGFILEQPPANIKDFLKQRQRWLSGMKLVIQSPDIKRRYKAVITMFSYMWQLSFASISLSMVIVLLRLHPPLFVQITTDFCSAVYITSYLLGNIVTSHITKRPWMVLTTALYPLYGILESIGALMALRKVTSFYVVKKPRADTEYSLAIPEHE